MTKARELIESELREAEALMQFDLVCSYKALLITLDALSEIENKMPSCECMDAPALARTASAEASRLILGTTNEGETK